MRKLLTLVFSLIAIAAAMWGVQGRDFQMASDPFVPTTVAPKTATAVTKSLPAQGANAVSTSQKESFAPPIAAQLAKESLRSGQLDPDPAASEERLREMAARLKAADLDWLRSQVLNSQKEGDWRVTSVELLARSPALEAIPLNEAIVLSPVPSSEEALIISFEKALRARALEGIESHPSPNATKSLQRIASQAADPFLADRAHRALAHRQGLAPSLRAQDETALGTLLTR